MNIDQHQRITVYTSESGLRRPLHLLKQVFSDIISSSSLAWRLFLRSYKAMYRQSLLGFVWAFIPPVITSVVWVFLNGQNIINIEDTIVPYPAFVLTSVLLWSVFAQALITPLSSMMEGRSIMIKINFPKEALILSGFFQVLFDFLIKLSLIILVFIIYKVTPSPAIFLAPLGVLSLIILGMSIGLILLPVGMLYTDIQRFVMAIVPFWMLLTPVIYPAPREGIATLLNKFNPVSPILATTRDWMLSGSSGFVVPFLWVTGASVLLLFFGIVLFRLAIPVIIERSGS